MGTVSLRCVTCHSIEDAIRIQQPPSLNQDTINFNKKREYVRWSKLVIPWTLITEISHVTVPFQNSTGMLPLITLVNKILAHERFIVFLT